VHVIGVEVSSPEITAQIEPVIDGERYSIQLTVPASFDVPTAAVALTIKTDDETFEML